MKGGRSKIKARVLISFLLRKSTPLLKVFQGHLLVESGEYFRVSRFKSDGHF